MVENKISAVAELEKPLKRVLDDLYEKIVNDVYGVIIGEDRGGRIPALILRRAINIINISQEKPITPIIFIQGFRNEGEYNLFEEWAKFATDFLYAQTSEQNKKALLVSEYIQTGNTLYNFSKFLRRNDVSFDVAAVTMMHPINHYKNLIPASTVIYSGNIGAEPPRLSGESQLSGLTKNKVRKERALTGFWEHQRAVEARIDAQSVADSIAERVLFKRGR